MPEDNRNKIGYILNEVIALKTSMDLVLQGTTEDHSKWVSFKLFTVRYVDLAKRYMEITGDPVATYKTDKLKTHMDTLWPNQKLIFETIYNDVLILHGRLTLSRPQEVPSGFDDLLHPIIRSSCIGHYNAGSYRNAVLDAVTAVFDKIRERTGIDLDGDKLCTRVFSVDKPVLVFSEVNTESGRNDQVGFMNMLQGFYRGVRNPKAHSLNHDLDALKASQHLVVASLLMRRVCEATSPPE